MQRFFVHLRTPDGLERDDVGVDFQNIEEVYLDAFDAVGTMSVELVRDRKNPRLYSFEIENEQGEIIMELPFYEYLDHGRKATRHISFLKLQKECVELQSRCGKAKFEVLRSQNLRAALLEEWAALQDTFTETRRLLDQARRVTGLV